MQESLTEGMLSSIAKRFLEPSRFPHKVAAQSSKPKNGKNSVAPSSSSSSMLWMKNLEFSPFLESHNFSSSDVKEDEFEFYLKLEYLESTLQALNIVLSSNDEVFLGQILCDDGLKEFLSSYLLKASRPHDASIIFNELVEDEAMQAEDVKSLTFTLDAISRKILMLFLRVKKHVSNCEDNLTFSLYKKHKQEALKRIFSLDLLIHLIVLYGDANQQCVQEIVGFAFEHESCWLDKMEAGKLKTLTTMTLDELTSGLNSQTLSYFTEDNTQASQPSSAKNSSPSSSTLQSPSSVFPTSYRWTPSCSATPSSSSCRNPPLRVNSENIQRLCEIFNLLVDMCVSIRNAIIFFPPSLVFKLWGRVGENPFSESSLAVYLKRLYLEVVTKKWNSKALNEEVLMFFEFVSLRSRRLICSCLVLYVHLCHFYKPSSKPQYYEINDNIFPNGKETSNRSRISPYEGEAKAFDEAFEDESLKGRLSGEELFPLANTHWSRREWDPQVFEHFLSWSLDFSEEFSTRNLNMAENQLCSDLLYGGDLLLMLENLKEEGNIDDKQVEFLSDIFSLQQAKASEFDEEAGKSDLLPIAGVMDSVCSVRTLEETQYQPPNVSMESIRIIRDIFTDLGDGFIAVCLSYWNNNVDETMNSLLEDNLPPHLRSLSTKMDLKEGNSYLKAEAEGRLWTSKASEEDGNTRKVDAQPEVLPLKALEDSPSPVYYKNQLNTRKEEASSFGIGMSHELKLKTIELGLLAESARIYDDDVDEERNYDLKRTKWSKNVAQGDDSSDDEGSEDADASMGERRGERQPAGARPFEPKPRKDRGSADRPVIEGQSFDARRKTENKGKFGGKSRASLRMNKHKQDFEQRRDF